MHPWLISTEAFILPTYFTVAMVAVATAPMIVVREARREGLAPRRILDMGIFIVPAMLIGARVAHVLFENPAYYLEHPWAIFSPQGGLTFYGGIGGVVLTIWSWCRHQGLPFWRVADICAPTLGLGIGVGRMACLGAGCCYGRLADWPLGIAVPWAVRYHHRGHIPDALLGVPLHPSPLYESLIGFTLFVVLTQIRKTQRFTGQVGLMLVVLYGVGRSTAEIFRGDLERGFWIGGWLSTSQVIGLLTACIAVILYISRYRACTQSSST